MKRKLSSLFLGISLVLSSLGIAPCVSAQDRESEQPLMQVEQKDNKQKKEDKSKQENNQNDNSQQKVYVCYGPKAYAYHNNRQCQGLKRCSSCIKTIPINEAKKEKRKACGFCYGK